MIPYGRQSIDEDDIKAVVEVLKSDWLTTGPKVVEFEEAVADYVGAQYAVAVSSGTAALHAAMYALEIGPGDEVIVSPMTFAATANCVAFQGGTPIFVDVAPDTLLIDPDKVAAAINEKTRAIIAVDYTGHPCDYDKLKEVADEHGLALVADGCHALGAEYKGKKVGSLADMTVFSFHPVKHIATGEGGIITTDDEDLDIRMRLFRNHGITRDPKCFSFPPSHRGVGPYGPEADLRPLTSDFSWYYEMLDLGFNYRITDIQCALGLSQLQKLPEFLQRRRKIAAHYNEAFSEIPEITPLSVRPDVLHAYHLYVVKVDYKVPGNNRNTLFQSLREKGIGVNVHYIPVHLHPYYQKQLGCKKSLCPVAEEAYKQILSLPMFPGMSDEDMENVVTAVRELL
jgi:perosamine synthetase